MDKNRIQTDKKQKRQLPVPLGFLFEQDADAEGLWYAGKAGKVISILIHLAITAGAFFFTSSIRDSQINTAELGTAINIGLYVILVLGLILINLWIAILFTVVQVQRNRKETND